MGTELLLIQSVEICLKTQLFFNEKKKLLNEYNFGKLVNSF